MKIIKKILTHLHPHLDEFFAELLMKKFGVNQVHILSNTQHEEVCVADEGVKLISQNNPSWLCLGIGGGPFDDHGLKAKKSASMLVAEYLEIEEDPRLIVLIELITKHDKEKSSSNDQFTLPRAINFLHRYGYSSKAVREWVEQGLMGLIDSEALLLERIKSEIKETVPKEELKKQFMYESREWEHFNLMAISKTLGNEGPKWLEFAQGAFDKQKNAFKRALEIGEKSISRIKTKFGLIRMMSIDATDGFHSDYEIEFDACSRHAKVRADLVLVRNSMGHTLVAANPSFRGNLAGFVKVLRLAEAQKRNSQVPQKYLITEGSIPLEGFTSWYVHEGIGYRRIYNGTITRPVVDFSELSFAKTEEILLKWLELDNSSVMPSKQDDYFAVSASVSVRKAFDKAADDAS